MDYDEILSRIMREAMRQAAVEAMRESLARGYFAAIPVGAGQLLHLSTN